MMILDMSDAFPGFTQSMNVYPVTKTTVNFKIVETVSDNPYQGVWQALSPSQLMLKPEGQRSWSWWQFHTKITIVLKNDDVVFYENKKYRVMATINHSKYGYMEYHLVEDFEDVP